MKKGRYQYLIGGNSVKTIGDTLVDRGLLKAAGVSQDLQRVKNFASDLLVLKLASASTVGLVLSQPCADYKAAIALATTLFFVRVHLFSINSKRGAINAKQHIIMLQSSFIFFLHIDGVYPITKKNLLLECISMSFSMLRSNVISPGRITTELSEHSIAFIRRIIPEGTVLDFSNSIRRISKLQIAVASSSLLTIRNGSGDGYLSTINKHATSDTQKRLSLVQYLQKRMSHRLK